MSDQKHTSPVGSPETEVDWAERLRASMNEAPAEAEEPTATLVDEEDDLAALLRAQLTRQSAEPEPELPDTTEFEEEFEEEPEEFFEEEVEEHFEEDSEEIFDEAPEEELDEELDEESEEIFDDEPEEALNEEIEESLDEEEFEEDLDEGSDGAPTEDFEEILDGEPEEIFDEEFNEEFDDGSEELFDDDGVDSDEPEEEEIAAAVLTDDLLNGRGAQAFDGDILLAPSDGTRFYDEDLRAVREDNARVLEEETVRREAAARGFAEPTDESNVDISAVAAVVRELPSEEPDADEDAFAPRRSHPAVIGYDPLQIGHGTTSARAVSDILDGELPVGAYAKPETESTDYTAKMVGTSEADVHLRDTALWMDMGYGADVRHAEERRAAEQIRSEDAPVADPLREERQRTNVSANEKIHTVRAELESARESYPKTRIFCIVRLIAAFVGAVAAVIYGCLPAARESVTGALSPMAYPLLSLCWMLLLALPFATRLARGVMGLVRFAPTRYSVTSLAMAVSLVYTGLSVIACAIGGDALPPIEGIPLCMLAVAALTELFETVGAGDALSVVTSGRAVYVLSDGDTPAATALSGYVPDELVPRKRPRPLTAVRTAAVDHAVARMRQYNPYMSRLNYLLPAALGTAIVVAGIALLRGGHFLADGVRVFAVTYLASLPAAYLVAMSLPLHMANGRMRSDGCAIVGTAAPETYTRPQSARRRCELLFPERDVILAARRKEITLREDDAESISRWRRMANRLFHLLGLPLAVDMPLEDDGSPEALAHLHVEISETDVHYMKVYLVDDTPGQSETTEIVMGSHDALSRRGIRLPKRAMESVYRKSEDSHVLYLAFNGRFRMAYAAEYRVDPAFLDTVKRLGGCGMRPVMVSYDPMLTSAMLIEPRFAALGNMEVVRPDYTDVASTLCSSGVVATHGSRDLVYPLTACRRIHTCYRLSHALAWLGYAAVSTLALVAVLTNGNAYVNAASAVGAQAVFAALFALLSWITVYRPSLKPCLQRLMSRITKK